MDKDLEFLRNCSNEELNVLVKLMNDKLSCDLSVGAIVDPVHHVEEIADEFCLFGGNTVANILRFGEGVSYREILTDVCDKLKVPYNYKHNIEHIERNMLETVLENAWDEMDEEERKKFLNDMGYKGDIPKGGMAWLLMEGGKAAGFGLYQGAMILANVVAKQVTGVGLSLAVNAAINHSIKIFLAWLGPILWGWMLLDIASSSKKVTIPGCIYIASMRQLKCRTIMQKIRC